MELQKRIWQKLPMKHTDDGRCLDPKLLISALSAITLEWMLTENRDESVRSHEYPVLKRIQDGIINEAFDKEQLENVKKALELYVSYGDDTKATDIACKILKKTPKELGAGSMAARQILNEIKKMGKC